MGDLLLDPQLRDWALFPVIVVTVLVQFLREYISKSMEPVKKVDVKDLRIRCVRARVCGVALRDGTGAAWLGASAWACVYMCVRVCDTRFRVRFRWSCWL